MGLKHSWSFVCLQGESRHKSRTFFGKFPLVFDGAFGLTKLNHGIELYQPVVKQRFELYGHFIRKHKLKKDCAQRLLDSIVNEQNPTTAKLFEQNENVLDPVYKVRCPFTNGTINIPGYNLKNIKGVPWRSNGIRCQAYKHHLIAHHGVCKSLAQRLANDLKEILTRANTTITPVFLVDA